jgi:hypothetical protein
MSISGFAVRLQDELRNQRMKGEHMVYIMMIYADEADWVGKSEAEMAPIMAQHDQIEADLRKEGRYHGCGGLAPSTEARTVRLDGATPVVSDGPYAETKEMFGGYYLIEADSIDEVLPYAARIPGFAKRAVEIRPILAFRS